MRLTERITTEGQRLFRLRSFVPLALLPAVYFALLHMASFEQRWGDDVEDLWVALCVCVSGFGFLLRCITVGFVPAGTSGRSRGAPGAAALNTLGMYSIVRNPLYLANGLMWLGVALATTSAWFVLIGTLVYWLYIERVICAEESFLAARFGEEFTRWSERTPCFLPRPSLWLPSDIPFSLRTVLRREYSGIMAIGFCFTLFKFVSHTFVEGEAVARWLVTDRNWVIFLAITFFIGLTLQFMKNCSWLDASGR
jgi:protein-S-isoprenylcysteine O-methyltransferase Ste14